MSKKFIIIEGIIGAGKTSLAKAIADRLEGDVTTFLEPAEGDNPYLPLYYADPERYAFHMQIFLLWKRFRAHKAAQSLVLAGHCHCVGDRSYFGDRAFADVQLCYNYLSSDDYETYLGIHKDMQRSILYPSALVYLETPIELAMQRILKRQGEVEGRDCEDAIDVEYMVKLDEAVSSLVLELERFIPVIRVYPLDDAGNELTLEELADEALEGLKQLDMPDVWQGV